ncbi:unnamed protein product [Amoebophrya sp. A25]|nr:unnamed protein product [Amoebophrya sp. A25]|eukprot:GSA25T00018074001.1
MLGSLQKNTKEQTLLKCKKVLEDLENASEYSCCRYLMGMVYLEDDPGLSAKDMDRMWSNFLLQFPFPAHFQAMNNFQNVSPGDHRGCDVEARLEALIDGGEEIPKNLKKWEQKRRGSAEPPATGSAASLLQLRDGSVHSGSSSSVAGTPAHGAGSRGDARAAARAPANNVGASRVRSYLRSAAPVRAAPASSHFHQELDMYEDAAPRHAGRAISTSSSSVSASSSSRIAPQLNDNAKDLQTQELQKQLKELRSAVFESRPSHPGRRDPHCASTTGMAIRSLPQQSLAPQKRSRTFTTSIGDLNSDSEHLTPSSQLKRPRRAHSQRGPAARGLDELHAHASVPADHVGASGYRVNMGNAQSNMRDVMQQAYDRARREIPDYDAVMANIGGSGRERLPPREIDPRVLSYSKGALLSSGHGDSQDREGRGPPPPSAARSSARPSRPSGNIFTPGTLMCKAASQLSGDSLSPPEQPVFGHAHAPERSEASQMQTSVQKHAEVSSSSSSSSFNLVPHVGSQGGAVTSDRRWNRFGYAAQEVTRLLDQKGLNSQSSSPREDAVGKNNTVDDLAAHYHRDEELRTPVGEYQDGGFVDFNVANEFAPNDAAGEALGVHGHGGASGGEMMPDSQQQEQDQDNPFFAD